MSLIGTVGSIGQQVNLLISKGNTFGPHEVTLTNPDGTPYDLTGCSVLASMDPPLNNSAAKVAMSVVFTNRLQGKFTFGLSHTQTAELLSNKTLMDRAGTYTWGLKVVDTNERHIPVFYGEASCVHTA